MQFYINEVQLFEQPYEPNYLTEKRNYIVPIAVVNMAPETTGPHIYVSAISITCWYQSFATNFDEENFHEASQESLIAERQHENAFKIVGGIFAGISEVCSRGYMTFIPGLQMILESVLSKEAGVALFNGVADF